MLSLTAFSLKNEFLESNKLHTELEHLKLGKTFCQFLFCINPDVRQSCQRRLFSGNLPAMFFIALSKRPSFINFLDILNVEFFFLNKNILTFTPPFPSLIRVIYFSTVFALSAVKHVNEVKLSYR